MEVITLWQAIAGSELGLEIQEERRIAEWQQSIDSTVKQLDQSIRENMAMGRREGIFYAIDHLTIFKVMSYFPGFTVKKTGSSPADDSPNMEVTVTW